MKKLTQLQYEVIFLYSKGLTFKEIDSLLKTSSKGVYTQVLAKDKGRVTRAKISREKNVNNYKINLLVYMCQVKEHNKRYKNSTQWIKDRNTIPIKKAKANFRKKYLHECMDKSFKSYSKYKITVLRKIA